MWVNSVFGMRMRYDAKKGSFPAYAVITVRGYILERLKKEFAVQEKCVCVGEEAHFILLKILK